MTVMQSQYFAFIHAYTNVMNSRHPRRTCSDIRDVSADRHQMVLTLARKGSSLFSLAAMSEVRLAYPLLAPE